MVAGAVASIPISYKVDDSIFASFPGENAFSNLSLNANQIQSGFQSVGFKVNKQNLLTDVTVSHITSACMREKDLLHLWEHDLLDKRVGPRKITL